jgi:purine-binding chemotaxis protein CheW
VAAPRRRSPEEARALLAARAQRLARRPTQTARALAALDVLAFALGEERYAIETRYVREVVRAGVPTPVPGTVDYVLGLTNLRGDLVAVVDLRRLLGTAAADVTAGSPLLIVGDDRAQLGVLIDSVHEVSTLAADAVLDPSASLREATREYVRGVTREGLVLLDGHSLLTAMRLVPDAEEQPG